jgi:hypothetical protein
MFERWQNVDYFTMWAFAHSEGAHFQKTALASEQERPDLDRQRTRWKAKQSNIEPNLLAFNDETWAKIKQAPLRGWAART